MPVLLGAIDAFAVAVLAWIALEDIAKFKIRNELVALLAVLSALRAMLPGGEPELLWHGAFAAAILVVMFGVFALGGMGAGDAKLMTVGGLWIGPDRALPFACLLLFCVIITYVLVKLRWFPTRNAAGRRKMPFGPSIACSWIVTILASP